jgi:hypothetical protein
MVGFRKLGESGRISRKAGYVELESEPDLHGLNRTGGKACGNGER